jgi:hypothetical protein
MLEEIRDTLRAMDPLLEDIDRRNMLYARSSKERVKALLEPDSTIAGKLGALIRDIYTQGKETKDAEDSAGLHHRLIHRLHHIRTFAPESLYRRYQREAANFSRRPSPADQEAMDRVEEELYFRLRRQLGVARISEWLDESGGVNRLLAARDLVRDESSFIHFIYSVLYADSRPSFTYNIEDTVAAGGAGGGAAVVKTGAYVVPDVLLRRKG